MVCGADSIDDMDPLRHGGMGRLFADVRPPSTLSTVHTRRRTCRSTTTPARDRKIGQPPQVPGMHPPR